MTLVDTNVFVDVIHRDPIWLQWSVSQLAMARQRGPVIANFVVYAELHTHDTAGPHVDALLDQMGVQLRDLSRPAAQLAAKAFRQYRQRGGTRAGVLPDFFIGAQALSGGWPLLTRDAARYRTYFPGIQLICPN
jgi:predicted nucleic acid-binding protein